MENINHTILRVVHRATESARHSGPQLQLLIRCVRIWKTMPEKQHKKEINNEIWFWGILGECLSEFPDVYLDFCDSLQQNTRQCLKCSPLHHVGGYMFCLEMFSFIQDIDCGRFYKKIIFQFFYIQISCLIQYLPCLCNCLWNLLAFFERNLLFSVSFQPVWLFIFCGTEFKFFVHTVKVIGVQYWQKSLYFIKKNSLNILKIYHTEDKCHTE